MKSENSDNTKGEILNERENLHIGTKHCFQSIYRNVSKRETDKEVKFEIPSIQNFVIFSFSTWSVFDEFGSKCGQHFVSKATVDVKSESPSANHNLTKLSRD